MLTPETIISKLLERRERVADIERRYMRVSCVVRWKKRRRKSNWLWLMSDER